MAKYKTVHFANGRTVRFRVGGTSRKRTPAVTGTPYLFAKGNKTSLPAGARKGEVFTRKGKTFLAVKYTNAQGDKIAYGQPVTLTRNARRR